MRLLHLSDTHLGIDVPSYGHPRGWRRADDHLDALRRALLPAVRGEADLVVHSGDLFDRSHPPAEAVAAAVDVLAEVARRVPVVVMPGNHDRLGLRTHLGTPPPGIHIYDQPARVVFGDLALALVPYRREHAQWSHDAEQAMGIGVDALVAHQSFEGARVPGFTFRFGHHRETVGEQGLPDGIRYILCGHVHPAQALRLGEAQVVFCGSTERTAFYEGPTPKGVACWDFGRTVRFELQPLRGRDLVRVQHERDLLQVTPGSCVRIDRDATPELARAVLQRGGWFLGVRPPNGTLGPAAQTDLFG